MKKYYLELRFAYKNDGPKELDKYGMALTEEDIKNKTYNQTFTRQVEVVAKNELEAGAKAMTKMVDAGWHAGNYLYLIRIKKLLTETVEDIK